MTVDVGRITIRYWVADDGDMLTSVKVKGDIPLATQLGLIDLARDTLLRDIDGVST